MEAIRAHNSREYSNAIPAPRLVPYGFFPILPLLHRFLGLRGLYQVPTNHLARLRRS